MSWERNAGSLLFVLAGAAFATVGLVLSTAPPAWSIGALVGDDAGYYFTIARNYCLGHGFSFDRLQPTNGFNPLLPWTLIPLFRLLPADLPLIACYRVGVLVGFAAMSVALAVFVKTLASTLDSRVFSGGLRRLALGAGTAFFALFVATKGYYGMDAPLVLMLGLLYVWRVLRGGLLAPGAAAAVIDGMLLGLAFLARVDTLPLLVAAFLVMALECAARRQGFRELAARLVVTSLVSLPYLVWSTIRFGTWLPVSARLKTSFPIPDPVGSLRVIRGSSLHLVDQASFLLAWMLALASAVMLARHFARARQARSSLPPRVAALGLLGIYLTGRFTYMLLFSRADVQGSYAILAHAFNVLALAHAAGAIARQASSGAGRRIAATAAAGLGVVAILLFAGKLQATLARRDLAVEGRLTDEPRLGREIHELTRPGDILYGGTFGILGFFTDRAWINLDGVVNTYAYQRVFIEPGARGEGGLVDYLRSSRVTHVVVMLPRDVRLGPGPLRLSAWGILHNRTNWFEVSPADILLKRPAGDGDLYVVRYRP